MSFDDVAGLQRLGGYEVAQVVAAGQQCDESRANGVLLDEDDLLLDGPALTGLGFRKLVVDPAVLVLEPSADSANDDSS